MKKTIGFIGAGNMAGAIIGGMVKSKSFTGDEICVYDTDIKKADSLKEEFGITVCKDNEELVKMSSAVLLAVKPAAFPTLLPGLSQIVKEENVLIISIAAGQSIKKIHALISCDIPIIRVMPNINAMASEAISGYDVNELVKEEDITLIEKILASTGKAVKIEERLFSVYSAIAGCSPAYVYDIINTVSFDGVRNSMTKSASLETVEKAFLEISQKMSAGDIEENVRAFLEKQENSIKADILSKNDFEKKIFNCLDAALNKDKKM